MWRRFRPKPIRLPEGPSSPFNYARSFADLEANIHTLVPNLHGDLDVAYQARLPAPAQQELEGRIDAARFLILVGRTGVGKTREAIEALRRWERLCGETVTILIPRPPFTSLLALPAHIPTQHIVLFLDNIHARPFYTPPAERAGGVAATAGDFPTFLGACLAYFKGYPDTRVIATARNDLPDRDYEQTVNRLRPLLDSAGCQEVALPGWHGNNLDGLINAVAAWRGVDIADDARGELARRCAAEGTPNYVLLAVSRVDKGTTLTLEQVKQLPPTFNTLWQRTWNERIAGYPARRHLFHSLAILRGAGLTPLRPLAVEVAARLWGRPFFWHRKQVRAALPGLIAWVEPKGGTLECPDAYLPQDVSLAQDTYAAVVYRALVHLLPQDPPRVAPELGNFANFLQEFPHGKPIGNLQLAIAAYTEALRFRKAETAPLNYAATQNNLGNAYSRLAAHRDPEANLGQAILAHVRSLVVRATGGVVQARRPAQALKGLREKLGADQFAHVLDAQAAGLRELSVSPTDVLSMMERWAR